MFDAFWSDDPKKALMHGPTYMANALACAAANASLDLFEQEPRLQQVAGIAAALSQGLAPCRGMAGVKDVRVKGAIGVVELERIDDLDALRARFVERGRVRAPVRQYRLSDARFHHRGGRTEKLDRRGGESRALDENLREKPCRLFSGPVIDTHHHIWLRKDVGWLADPPIPRMFGDYFGIRRDYPVEEWINDIVPQGVAKSVHVTAMWGPGRALDETRWLQAVADKHGFPHGIVCNVDLADRMLEAALKAQKQFPNLRGVRQMLYWDSDPVRQGASRPDYLQRSRIPPRLRAAGEARPAFRIAGLCRAGQIRGRADQGVSQRAHDPGACRHADRAHAGDDRAVARARSPPWRRSPICM